jgi:hypothetical protein
MVRLALAEPDPSENYASSGRAEGKTGHNRVWQQILPDYEYHVKSKPRGLFVLSI